MAASHPYGRFGAASKTLADSETPPRTPETGRLYTLSEVTRAQQGCEGALQLGDSGSPATTPKLRSDSRPASRKFAAQASRRLAAVVKGVVDGQRSIRAGSRLDSDDAAADIATKLEAGFRREASRGSTSAQDAFWSQMEEFQSRLDSIVSQIDSKSQDSAASRKTSMAHVASMVI